jgi:flagellar assembly factor FliW
MSHAHAGAAIQPLRVRSRFADAEVSPADVMTFPDGLPGYEGRRQFVLLDVAEMAPLRVLHAVNADEPCFLVVDPRSVLASYRNQLGAADRLRLGISDEASLLWLVIVCVRDDGEVTVNLRAPIVVDPARMIGRQVMPNDCVYPLHYVIGSGEPRIP